MSDLKDLSKNSFTPSKEHSNTFETIQTGCLQRIANSLERIEQPYQKLISDYEYLKTINARLRDSNQKLMNQVRAYKGHLSRLKKKEASDV